MADRAQYSIQQAVLKWEASGAPGLGLPQPGAYMAEGRIVDRLYLGPDSGSGWAVVDSGQVVRRFSTRPEAWAFYKANLANSSFRHPPKREPHAVTVGAVDSPPVVARPTSRQVSVSLRYNVLKRDDFRCVRCGRSPASEPGVQLQVDHVVPWSKGGETVLSNLQVLCSECNLGKSNRHIG